MNWLNKLLGKGEPNEPTETLAIRGGTLPIFAVRPESAQAEWLKRRRTATGAVVILVDPMDHSEMREDAEDGDPADIIKQSATINLPEFYADRFESLGLEEDEEVDEDYANDRREPDPAKLIKAKIPINAFTDVEPGKSTYLAEIPCKEPWQVFAHYAFGGWNDVTFDHELTAVCKDWFERFGAVPAVISGDVVEFWLDRPVVDPAIAAKLAMEMYILCPDAVDQGAESTEALANSILGANVWYFWWD